MKYLSLICIAFFFSCNEKKEILVLSENVTNTIIEEAILKTDTLKISLDTDLLENDLVLVQLLEKKYDKDSIAISKVRLDFYSNKKLINQSYIEVNGLEEGSEWYSHKGFDNGDDLKYSPLLTISNGYPACGYAHTHFLFYTDKNDFQLIETYFTVGDGGWFDDTLFKENSPKFLSSVKVSYWNDDSEDEEMGDLKFSDSIHYKLENKKWVKTFITPKDTVFRSKKIAFNDYHSVKE